MQYENIYYFREECVEYLNEILFRKWQRNELEPIEADDHDGGKCWFSDEKFKSEDKKENPTVEDQCHSSGKFGQFPHIKCNLKAGKTVASFLTIFFHKSSGYDCHLGFQEIFSMVTDEGIKKWRRYYNKNSW